AVGAFTLQDPSASVPALARGLKATRTAARQFASDADAAYVLLVKEQQFVDAINTALGIDFTAIAEPAGSAQPTGPGAAFAPPITMGPVVPDQMFTLKVRFTNRGSESVGFPAFSVDGTFATGEATGPGSHSDTTPAGLSRDQTVQRLINITLRDNT